MEPESNASVYRLADATGRPSSSQLARERRRPEDAMADIGTAFQNLESPAGGLPETKAAALFHAVKLGLHAHDRMEERTPFHRSHVDQIQRAVDTLPLHGESYHLPLRAKDGSIAGYAQFKRVPDRKGPVLATVLAPHMSPGGENIESMLKPGGQAKQAYDLRADAENWRSMSAPIPNMDGSPGAPRAPAQTVRTPPPPPAAVVPHAPAAVVPHAPVAAPHAPVAAGRGFMPRSAGGKAALGLGIASAGIGRYQALRPSQPQAQYKRAMSPETNNGHDAGNDDPTLRRGPGPSSPETADYVLRRAFDRSNVRPMHTVDE